MAHKTLPNIRFPTLGGQQLWLDVCFFAGWRIQKNILTGRYRLLNPKSIRYAWGSHEACLMVFTRLNPTASSKAARSACAVTRAINAGAEVVRGRNSGAEPTS